QARETLERTLRQESRNQRHQGAECTFGTLRCYRATSHHARQDSEQVFALSQQARTGPCGLDPIECGDGRLRQASKAFCMTLLDGFPPAGMFELASEQRAQAGVGFETDLAVQPRATTQQREALQLLYDVQH